jgi:hypothetical protein
MGMQIYNPEIAEAVCRDRKSECECRFESETEIYTAKIYLVDGSVESTTCAQQFCDLWWNRTWHLASEVKQLCLSEARKKLQCYVLTILVDERVSLCLPDDLKRSHERSLHSRHL